MKINQLFIRNACRIAMCFIFLLLSCEKDLLDMGKDEGQIELSFEMQQKQMNDISLKASAEDIDALIVSIETTGNQPVYTQLRVHLIKIGDEFISEPIVLVPDDYNLVDFLVVDADDIVLYATPKQGSPLEGSVKHALPIEFNIN